MKKSVLYKNGNALLSYAEYGDKSGFPVLIQHGLVASIDDDGLFERLVELRARLVCIARPGYGESSPYAMRNIAEWGDIVSVLVDELELAHFDVLGMSSGAPYSYAIGYRFPDRVRNIYIFSGTPALYDEKVQSCWPYEVDTSATLADLERLAQRLFFSDLSEEDLRRNDVCDSMRNHCFGIALDLKLRCLDWGFRLSDVRANIYMQHSRTDSAVPLDTAVITSRLLPTCRLEIVEDGVHFSKEALDNFVGTVISGHYEH